MALVYDLPWRGLMLAEQLEGNFRSLALKLELSELETLDGVSAAPKDYILTMHKTYPRLT